MPWPRVIGCSVLAAAFVVLAAGPAAAVTPLDAQIAKQKSGPYADELAFEIQPGDAKNFHVRVQNTSGEHLDVLLLANLNVDPRYKEKYFKGDRNITNKVSFAHGGFKFGLGALKAKDFRLRVKVTDTGAMLASRCLLSRFEPTPPEFPDDEDIAVLELNGECQ